MDQYTKDAEKLIEARTRDELSRHDMRWAYHLGRQHAAESIMRDMEAKIEECFERTKLRLL